MFMKQIEDKIISYWNNTKEFLWEDKIEIESVPWVNEQKLISGVNTTGGGWWVPIIIRHSIDKYTPLWTYDIDLWMEYSFIRVQANCWDGVISWSSDSSSDWTTTRWDYFYNMVTGTYSKLNYYHTGDLIFLYSYDWTDEILWRATFDSFTPSWIRINITANTVEIGSDIELIITAYK